MEKNKPTEFVPDLGTLLKFEGYAVHMKELDVNAAEKVRSEIMEQPRFHILLEDFNKKGYKFPEDLSKTKLWIISVKKEKNAATLSVGTFSSLIKEEDATLAVISVALDRDSPESSLFMGHMGNVYGLEPNEMPRNGSITFNNEPWFTVQVAQVTGMQVGAVTWFRYWWYDSHHHKNWWFGPYSWFYRWYQWHDRPWRWWYNWWWGWYHWRHWWFWSKLWMPYWVATSHEDKD